MSRARDLLKLSPDWDQVKLLSDTERGKIYEYMDSATGRTTAFRFVYADGRNEFKKVRWDPSWE